MSQAIASLSVIGLPRDHGGRTVFTGIWKESVDGRPPSGISTGR
jgi:hypothetical protein